MRPNTCISYNPAIMCLEIYAKNELNNTSTQKSIYEWCKKLKPTKMSYNRQKYKQTMVLSLIKRNEQSSHGKIWRKLNIYF